MDGAGTLNGENPSMSGSPKAISANCSGFTLSSLAWCQGVPNYYVTRSTATRYLFSDQLRVGMSGSYDGKRN